MRLKILSVFAAIQVLSFGLWSTISHAQPTPAVAHEHGHVHPAPDELASITNIEQSELSLHFATRNMEQGKRFLNSIKKNQIETALKKMPQGHVDSVDNIILDYDIRAHRGLGGNNMIILRGVNMSTQEMVGVLIHELGHNVDYGYLDAEEKKIKSAFVDGKMPIYESDPSLDFYRISWLSNDQRKRAATNMDFVSGYAMSDPFEDFAEAYTYYVMHNRDFKVRAADSPALYAKYRFMKYEVFNGFEFDTGDGIVKENQRPWDITVLSYDLSQFL